jgi:hypothetical protein
MLSVKGGVSTGRVVTEVHEHIWAVYGIDVCYEGGVAQTTKTWVVRSVAAWWRPSYTFEQGLKRIARYRTFEA